MCGTSLDGIDAALVDIVPQGRGYRVSLEAFATVALDDDLERDIRAAFSRGASSLESVVSIHHRFGLASARAARAVAGQRRVDYVASHGITMFHDGAAHLTLQLGDPAPLREALAATVCYDFRSADCALGGHGAPLVPYADALLLADDGEDRVALNIGGIANATFLLRGLEPHDVLAFDTGPGNMLVDAWLRERNGARYDDGGAHALRGRADANLLDAMLAHPYFAAPPPKSTGREQFERRFLEMHRAALQSLHLDDAIATLTEVTVASIAAQISKHAPGARVLVSGGGARNAAIMNGLRERLRTPVESSAAAGVDPDAKEAIAFALLGYETLRGRAANVPRVTGAARAVCLGAIVPHDLRRLFERIEGECRSL